MYVAIFLRPGYSASRRLDDEIDDPGLPFEETKSSGTSAMPCNLCRNRLTIPNDECDVRPVDEIPAEAHTGAGNG